MCIGGYSTCGRLLVYTQMGSVAVKTERINIRTTKQLKDKIARIAQKQGVPVAELINDYIKQLPEPQ